MAFSRQSLAPPERTKLLQIAQAEQVWDVLVIGGGATGLGIALDACTRGYRVLVLEQADFAKGTSSRSTKLVHGGVRYLAQGNVALVREASIERGLLVRNAPHLVHNQTFVVPVYTLWDRIKYHIGLKLYDWMAGRLGLGPSRFLSRARTLQRIPELNSEGLKGGILYHDGQFDDSRLAINVAQSILECGGLTLNYVRVTDVLKDDQGRINGVTAVDSESSQSFLFRAKAVVNATGVFVDDILQMDNPGARKTVTVSQGVHVVLDRSFYSSDEAMMIPKTSDGRVLFAVPWHQKVVLGTTDTPLHHASLEPLALEQEISFILDTAAQYLTRKPERGDVRSVFAGLRPLAAPEEENQKTKEISRSHKIVLTSSGLFTMLGGKWTTFRKMGEDMVDRVEKELGWPPRQSGTRQLAIHGAGEVEADAVIFQQYGTDASSLLQDMAQSDEAGWLSKDLQIHAVQVRRAVEWEMARTVEDFLARRTRALFLDAREATRIAFPVARLMAKYLGKGDDWISGQVAAFEALAARYMLSSTDGSTPASNS